MFRDGDYLYVNPMFKACPRCKKIQDVYHLTDVRVADGGSAHWSMHVLCNDCWHAATERERLEYYRAAWLSWEPTPDKLDEWFRIEQALAEYQNGGIVTLSTSTFTFEET